MVASDSMDLAFIAHTGIMCSLTFSFLDTDCHMSATYTLIGGLLLHDTT